MADQQTTQGHANTTSASRYLQQLCKHWSHKAATEFTQTHGTISFDSGNRVELTATDAGLEIAVSTPSGGDLDQWKDVVEKQLVRFAFREDFAIDWAD